MYTHYTKSKRCQCYNINNKICNNRQKNFYIYKMKRVCSFHFRILFYKYILIIQKIYRGYISKKKLNYFYKRLPHDIQYKIKYFINKELYIKKFNNNLILVINQKLNKFIIKYYNLLNETSIGYPIEQLEEYLLNEYNIIEHYRLFSKYNNIIIIPILINMELLWHKIFDYNTNICQYYFDNNLNNNEIISTLNNIEYNIRFIIFQKLILNNI